MTPFCACHINTITALSFHCEHDYVPGRKGSTIQNSSDQLNMADIYQVESERTFVGGLHCDFVHSMTIIHEHKHRIAGSTSLRITAIVFITSKRCTNAGDERPCWFYLRAMILNSSRKYKTDDRLYHNDKIHTFNFYCRK